MSKRRTWLYMVFAGLASLAGLGTEAETARAAERAHDVLWEKFIGADGLIHDFVGETPTPEECAQGRPNAIGWWSPIENGPMFTGTYLASYCERVKREKRPEDRERIRRLVKGLLLCASVSDVKGFIARGVGTDGKCHYPLGSQDQTHPWFYGLHAYAMSGIPDEAERQAVVDKMKEVADALEALDWKCPCDGAFKGQSRGDFKSFRNHGAVMYLFNLRAMYDVTRDGVWLARYRKARDERSPKSGKTRLEICSEGYPHDREEIKNIDQGQLWIYVSSQGALARLAEMEEEASAKARYREGLAVNARGALAAIGAYKQFDNADAKVFGHARWREGYPGWFEQKTQADAERLASTGNPAVLGQRKGYEVRYMRNPLAAAAHIALAGYREGFEEAERAIRHYDYSKLNMAELFFAEVAFYALPAGLEPVPVGSGRQLFLDGRLIDSGRTRGVTRTVNPPRDIRRVLKPEQPWESLGFIFYSSVVDDEKEIKLYYGSYTLENGKLQRHFCLATSRDGVAFERPPLGQVAFNGSKANNLLSPTVVEASVFLDPRAPDSKRYRMIYSAGGLEDVEKAGVYTATSPDGVAWTVNGTRLLPFVPDSQHTAYWDERAQRYAVYMRCWDTELKKRQVCRAEVADLDQPWSYDRFFPAYYHWGKEKIPTLSREFPVVLAPDGEDPRNLDLYTNATVPYPFAANAFLAFPAAYFKYIGAEWKTQALGSNDGTFEVQLATSEDGVVWTRQRQPYLAPGTYDGVDLRLVSLARGFVRRGSWLCQYFVGWPHTHGRPSTWERDPAVAEEWMRRERGGIFMARQRIDGFISMDGAYEGGVLTTRPLVFTGNRLRLNIDTRGAGCAKVALLDAAGAAIPGFTTESCEAISADGTDFEVHWKEGSDLGMLAGKPVRVQVEMRDTKLYALQFVSGTDKAGGEGR